MKKLLKLNKKGFAGEGDKTLSYILLVLPLITGVVILSFFFVGQIKEMVLSQEVQSSAYEARLLYSPDCFAYRDETTGRVYSGTVSPEKITTEVLRGCVPLQGTANHALAVEVKSQDGTKVAYITTQNWDINPKRVTANSYIVEIKNNGPGIITFFHKEGN
ncbi:MAG: hypothetical protein ACP5N3_01280 [Candidatus Nanoarchaeia archaeon]